MGCSSSTAAVAEAGGFAPEDCLGPLVQEKTEVLIENGYIYLHRVRMGGGSFPRAVEYPITFNDVDSGYVLCFNGVVLEGDESVKCPNYTVKRSDGTKVALIKTQLSKERKTSPYGIFTYARTANSSAATDTDDEGEALYPFATIVKLGGDGLRNPKPSFEYKVGTKDVVTGRLTTDGALNPKINWTSAAAPDDTVAIARELTKNVKDADNEWETKYFNKVVVPPSTDALGMLVLSICAARYWNDSQGSSLD